MRPRGDPGQRGRPLESTHGVPASNEAAVLLFFPYSTDAPVYHWPAATVGLILANLAAFVVFGAQIGSEPFGALFVAEHADDSVWLLAYGEALRPDQWFGSRFMHGGWGHLIGNMVFLWVFGLVAEGKLGWWRFLAVYLTIAIGQAAVEQAIMWSYRGVAPGSLGASAAIYGVMVIAALWAPVNNIEFGYLYLVGLYSGVGSFGVPVGGLCVFFVGMDLVLGLVFGGSAGSSLLHVMGAVAGLPIGLLLLRRGVIDCEGFDALSLWGPRATSGKEERESEPDQRAAQQRRAATDAQRDQRVLADAAGGFDEILASGNATAALTLVKKLERVRGGIELDPSRLRRLIKGLQAEGQWSETAPLLDRLAAADPAHADTARVELARLCVVELGRPGRALELLGDIALTRLSNDQQQLAHKVASRARAMQDAGHVELDDASW